LAVLKYALLMLLLALIPLLGHATQPEPLYPSDLKLQVSVRNHQTRFRMGEVINLELQFSSNTAKKYHLDTASYDRSGRMSIEQFDVLPATGRSDPLAVYFQAFAAFMGGGLSGTKDLSPKPEMIELQLNEWVRFDLPGRYRITIDSARAFAGGFGTPGPQIRVKSNTIDVEIVPADPHWQQQTLRAAVDALGTGSMPASAAPGVSSPRLDAIKILRYLGTPAAGGELAKRLDDSDTSGDFAFGLIGSPSHDAALREMEHLLADPEFPVQSRFISALSVVALDPGAVSPDLPDQRSTLEAQYRDQLALLLDSKRGRGQSVSANTIVEEAAIRGHELPSAAKRKLTAVLVAGFDQLSEDAQASLLQYRWPALDHETALPLLRRVAQRYKDFPQLREMHAWNYNNASAAALKEWYRMTPDEARPAIVQEILRPHPRYDAKTLGILPDASLPEVDAPLVAHLAATDDYDTLNHIASLLHRYATAAVEPQVITYLDPKIGDIGCTVEWGLLAYLLKVDPEAARPRLQSALTARLPQNRCWADLFTGVGAFEPNPVLRDLALAGLNDPAPEVVANAAAYLGSYGDASAEDALWARLVDWNAKWAPHADEPANHDWHHPTDAQRWQPAEQRLVDALTAPVGWFADEPRLSRILALATDDYQRSHAQNALHYLHEQPWTVRCFPGDPIAISMAQYESMSPDGAKRKIGQLQRGTILLFDDLGIKSDAADRVFEALRSAAADHGITISKMRPQ
jgi:hypothetical protein